MKRKGILIHTLLGLVVSTGLFAGNAPIQRIDVVNLLGANGSVPTSVTLSFENGPTTPCFTATLPYQGRITVWAGVGQACIAPITNIVVTPVIGPHGTVYTEPSPVGVSTNYYLNQLTVSENVPPTYDPTNGALVMPGTAQAVLKNY
ncbi:MAG: hypothetical protein P4L79_06160 [Legionella sp.]|uniref:hypothetical protein n=1 Tax=Legionella sp. TaxID=459 RepID=UPI0028507477|nr:hypothetical protein [Legionella sp.]